MVVEKLMSFQEIVERFQKGENLFDITIEKWRRIRAFLSEKGREHISTVLENAKMGGPFCLEFEQRCNFCPIHSWCRNPEGFYQNVMRYLYLYASTGDLYYKQRAIKEIDKFLEEIRQVKQEMKQRVN